MEHEVTKFRDLVVVMAKSPQAGRVKTRLGATIGADEALRVYLSLAGETWASLLQARTSCGFQVWLAYDPPGNELPMRHWLPGADVYLPQCAGDLGNRMGDLFRLGFEQGFKNVLLAGTDTPDLVQGHYAEAFSRAAPGRVVVGPSEDGGFYLLALSAPSPDLIPLFSGIPWGQEETRESLRLRVAGFGLEWVEIELLSDVDTLADLRRIRPGLLPPNPE